jgi:hypothetical protein
MTEETTGLAAALDATLFTRDPFPVVNLLNFSSDQRTRIMLFGTNLELIQGETLSAITARAEDAQMNVYPLTVEFATKPPELDPLTELIVRLNDNLPPGQTVMISVTLRGQTSNKVGVRIK